MKTMLEDITGLNVFGKITALPGEVTIRLGADGQKTGPENDCATEVTFGIDENRRVYISVSKGRERWQLDGRMLNAGRNEMFNRKSVIESRALFNGTLCLRWRAVFEKDRKLVLITETP
jgi:hypothetical protein